MAVPLTTITGTVGADNITTVNATVVDGLAGNDTISLTQANDYVNAAAGDDSIRLLQTAGVVDGIYKGQDGNDTITVTTSLAVSGFNAQAKLGKGEDTFQIANNASFSIANGLEVSGQSGNDTISFNNTTGNIVSSSVKGGDDNDSITIVNGNALTTSKVKGGTGNDTINFDGQDATSTSTIGGGKNKDFIIINGNATIGLVNGGSGKDSIAINASAVVGTISGGDGKDTISTSTDFLGGVIYGDNVDGLDSSGGKDLIGSSSSTIQSAASVYGGAGSDTITFQSATIDVVFEGGDGSDLITLSEGETATTINGGTGADTITVTTAARLFLGGGDDADSITVAVASATSITGGTGADTITATFSGGTQGQIDGGSDNDLIIFGTGAAALDVVSDSTSIIGGDGNDTISVASFASKGYIDGGAGADSIQLGATGAVVIEWANLENITGGGDSDTISIGNTTGTAFTSADTVTAGIASIAYQAGDVIALTSTAQTGPALNGLVYVGAENGSTVTGVSNQTAGTLAAWSDGTDTYFALTNVSGNGVAFRVQGADLVTNTTAANTTIAANTTNFGFTLGGSASTGLTITLA